MEIHKRPAIYSLQVQRNAVKANSNFLTKQALLLLHNLRFFRNQFLQYCPHSPPVTAPIYDVGGQYVTSLVSVIISYRPERKMIVFTRIDLVS
jgi:hypothetical protein